MRIFGFEAAKFKNLMLYVAERSRDDPTFGAVKLNKILFYADFLAYAELGKPITGARYQHLPQGPAPRALLPTEEELLLNGEAAIEKRSYHELQQSRLVPKQEADLSRFSSEELALVNRIVDAMWELDATTISYMSHAGFKGWQVTTDGEDIPYETVFLSVEDPSPEAIEFGQRLAAKYG